MKSDPPFKTDVVYNRPQIVLDLDKIQKVFIREVCLREKPENLFASLKSFAVGNPLTTKKTTPQKRVCDVLTQPTESIVSFDDNEIFSQLTFSLLGKRHIVKIFKQSFFKPDGRLDRSRFD